MPVRSRRLFLTALFAVSLLSGCALKKAAEGSQTTSQKTAKPLQRKPSVQSGKTAERPQLQPRNALSYLFFCRQLLTLRSSPSTSRLSFASAPKPPSMALRLRFRPFERQCSLLQAASMRFSPRSA